MQPLDLGDPVDGLDEDGFGEVVREVAVDAGARGPLVDQVNSGGQARGVEADLDLDAVEHRREDGTAAELALTLGLFLLRDLAAVQLEPAELLGGTGDDDRAPSVAD